MTTDDLTDDLFEAFRKLTTDTGVSDWTIGTVLSESTGDSLDNARMRARRWLENPPKAAIQWLELVRVVCDLSHPDSKIKFARELVTYLGVDNSSVSPYYEEKQEETPNATTTT